MLPSGKTAVVAALLAGAVLPQAVAAPAHAAPAHAAPAHAATPRTTALQQALDATVAAGVPGAVVEVREGRKVWSGTSGVAQLGSGRQVKAGDRFRAGSVTKSFVATVVLQLVAEGKLRLDDPVERHLPGLVPAGTHGERVTVRQLLNHTSGLPDFLTDVLLQKPDAIRTLKTADYTPRELVALAVEKGWKFDPGAQGAWGYSNTNYVVLGLMVERLTGHSLGQELNRRIIQPLHLTGTSFPTTPQLPGPHLNGYEWLDGATATPTDLTEFSPATIWSAGTLISTTHDLNSFYRALADGKLLPPHLLREMHTMQSMGPDRAGRSYGLGLEGTINYCGKEAPVWGHSGSVAGYNTFSFTTADGKRQVTLALNRNFTKSKEADAAAVRVLSTALCGDQDFSRPNGSQGR
ncbi:serine hydrolase domain-containing protein [Streptomyces sp. NPDC049555]|uniref:serine hydrolase domain-containing protein n=1 Tax=Streptomyces sp. NPDC049555 TaxID=3154930 RepID=UPI00342BADA0